MNYGQSYWSFYIFKYQIFLLFIFQLQCNYNGRKYKTQSRLDQSQDYKPQCDSSFGEEEPFKHRLNQAVLQIINSGELQYKDSFLLPNSDVYFGEMKDDKRCGRGTQIWIDGSFSEGTWLDDQAYGFGRKINFNGDIYEGEWLNNQANGYGEFYYINGTVYKGQWENDKKSGKGEETYLDGSYNGDFFENKKQGKGLLKWGDGATYEGEINKINQMGMENINGQMEDYIVDSGKIIKGTYIWPNGIIYTGNYKEDKKCGHGIFTWPDGRSYNGGWENGKQHGEGILTSPEGITIKGQWIKGKRVS